MFGCHGHVIDLCRFAQFFVSPQLLEGSLDREIEAVDNGGLCVGVVVCGCGCVCCVWEKCVCVCMYVSACVSVCVWGKCVVCVFTV